MENSDKALNTGAKRVYDVAPSEIFAEFMKSGWAPTPLTGITQDEVVSHCVRRRAELSAAFTGVRLVIPSGGPQQRSNDTDYLYRPHTAFADYTGVQGVEAHPDSVGHPIGQGFSTKGDAGKRRTGSNEKVTNILAHIAMQRLGHCAPLTWGRSAFTNVTASRTVAPARHGWATGTPSRQLHLRGQACGMTCLGTSTLRPRCRKSALPAPPAPQKTRQRAGSAGAVSGPTGSCALDLVFSADLSTDGVARDRLRPF
jgi:hypothetical protein